MKKFCLFLCIMISIAPPIHAKRRRKKGSIAQALRSPDSSKLKESLSLVSMDKFSHSFAKLPKEGNLPPIEKGEIDIRDQIAREAAPEKQKSYELPMELRKEEEQKANEEERIVLQFENADLQNFVQQISELFNITFISDEAIEPLPKGTGLTPTKALKGNKITFKTNKPLTRNEAWDLFITFLEIAGFAIVPQPDPTIYRIQAMKAAHRAPIPTYIGVNFETLPNNDQLIRYLYFVENAQLSSIQEVVKSLTSSSSGAPIFLQEQKAFILTDLSYNIKALMKIVKELDKVTMPQAMSVLKLKQVDAADVKKLYEELTQTGEKTPFRPFGARKQSTAIYFPENARMIVEPRTNSLILLGPKNAIAKIEEFVTKYIDVELDQTYSALHTYQLRYADAKAIAEIMNKTTQFGKNTEAGKSGGVRGADKYLREMVFTPEPVTNKLIIQGDYEDFLVAKNIIQELDQPRSQVAIEVLILSVDLRDTKELGSQIRSKVNSLGIPGLKDFIGKNTAFQTSGLFGGASGIQTNEEGSGFQRLLGNLLKLVSNAPAGNTIVTFGQDLFGVWGIFQALRTLTNTQVISNPFIVASSKTPAKVSIGETRRVADSTVFATDTQQSFDDQKAELIVAITPQINSDGKIVLQLEVSNTEFTNPDNPNNPSSGNKTQRIITTEAVLADNEVLALGGLIREQIGNTLSKTPILADIPVLGWLFKNRGKTETKNSILILISTNIIKASETENINKFTQEQMSKFETSMHQDIGAQLKDPIHRLFFAEDKQTHKMENFIFDRHKKTRLSGRKRRKRKKESKAAEFEITQNKPKQQLPIKTPSTITTIATPSTKLAQKTDDKIAPVFKEKKRSSRSISSFLTSEKERAA